MSDYTPTTEDMRKFFAFTKAGDRIHRTEQYETEFDRWFAEELARAYTKGYNAAIAASPTGIFYDAWNDENNPYRKAD